MNQKKLHLLTSLLLLTAVALIYGVSPKNILHLFFDINVKSVDLMNVFRAIMGLYLAMAILWAWGIINQQYWRTATLSNIFFMSGLASGRFISLIFDGVASSLFLIGLLVELALALWGIINLKKYPAN